MKKTSANKNVPWWIWIAGIDLFLLLVTWLEGYQIEIPYAWRLQGFRLTHEMNLAAWWSGASLFALGMLAYEDCFSGETKLRRALLPLALFFAFLSFDEIGSLHERLVALQYNSGMALATAALAIIPLCAAAATLRRAETRRTGVLLCVGVGLIASVAIQEMLEHAVDWGSHPHGLAALRGVFEEGSELLATLAFFGAMVALRGNRGGNGLAAIVADLRRARFVAPLILAGLALHLAACLLVLPGLDDIPRRGNPGIWYPVVLNLFLFALAYWTARNGAGYRRVVWCVAAIGFLLASATLMGNLMILVPGLTMTPDLPTRLLPLYAWQALFAAWALRDRGVRPFTIVAGLAGAAVLALLHLRFADDVGTVLVFYGAFVCGCALALRASFSISRTTRAVHPVW